MGQSVEEGECDDCGVCGEEVHGEKRKLNYMFIKDWI